jgi:hypothetical protein
LFWKITLEFRFSSKPPFVQLFHLHPALTIHRLFSILTIPCKSDSIGVTTKWVGRGEKNKMQKFKKGDAVKVRFDTTSPYRGRRGIVNENPVNDSYGFWYTVKFESRGYAPSLRFVEQDLEMTTA